MYKSGNKKSFISWKRGGKKEQIIKGVPIAKPTMLKGGAKNGSKAKAMVVGFRANICEKMVLMRRQYSKGTMPAKTKKISRMLQNAKARAMTKGSVRGKAVRRKPKAN